VSLPLAAPTKDLRQIHGTIHDAQDHGTLVRPRLVHDDVAEPRQGDEAHRQRSKVFSHRAALRVAADAFCCAEHRIPQGARGGWLFLRDPADRLDELPLRPRREPRAKRRSLQGQWPLRAASFASASAMMPSSSAATSSIST